MPCKQTDAGVAQVTSSQPTTRNGGLYTAPQAPLRPSTPTRALPRAGRTAGGTQRKIPMEAVAVDAARAVTDGPRRQHIREDGCAGTRPSTSRV